MDVEQVILQFTKSKYDELHAENARLKELEDRVKRAEAGVEVARSWSRAWKGLAREYLSIARKATDAMKELMEWEEEDLAVVKQLRAEVARLKELQPCGHPVQAIRSSPYIGDQHSSYCGWCADVDQLKEEIETWTRNLEDAQADNAANVEDAILQRAEVARLREALDKAATYFTNMIETPLGGEQSICGFCREEWSEHKEWCVFAAFREAAAD